VIRSGTLPQRPAPDDKAHTPLKMQIQPAVWLTSRLARHPFDPPRSCPFASQHREPSGRCRRIGQRREGSRRKSRPVQRIGCLRINQPGHSPVWNAGDEAGHPARTCPSHKSPHQFQITSGGPQPQPMGDTVITGSHRTADRSGQLLSRTLWLKRLSCNALRLASSLRQELPS
jgi:hypothetical protein